ncbi:NAD(+)/NADH kinase, partial [bacterium]|nr:NAD(+)/NADH kinase [bacterium]
LSFNMGNLGFLAAYSINRLYEVLEKTIEGDFTVAERMMLQSDHVRGDKILNTYTALNDVVVNKGMITRLIELETFVDNKLITTYLCDGLIISTPTGSTAYSLSAGGPIIVPTLNAVVMTPICPHTLTNRPMVLSGDDIITIRLVSDDRTGFLTLDGQISDSVCFDDRIIIRRSPYKARIIADPDTHFFNVLNHKLKWGYR